MRACRQGCMDVVLTLLEWGAKVEAKDKVRTLIIVVMMVIMMMMMMMMIVIILC